MVPKAAPMIIPTAISSTLPRIANSLNSLSILGSSSNEIVVYSFNVKSTPLDFFVPGARDFGTRNNKRQADFVVTG